MVFLPDSKADDGLPIIPVYINGSPQSIDASTTLFPVINAVSDITIHHAVSATPSVASAACEAASDAFKLWRRTTPSHRRSLLLKVADVVESKMQEIMQAQLARQAARKSSLPSM